MAKQSAAPSKTTATPPVRHKLKGFLIGGLILLGSVSFGAFVVTHWIERQVLTTDNWVRLVGPLPKEPVVAEALGEYISDQVFNPVAVKRTVAEALPPRAEFLSAPLTSQLQSLTTRTATTVVASDSFQSIWAGANQIAINRLVTTARDPSLTLRSRVNERFDLNLSEVRDKVRTALGDSSGAVPGLQAGASGAISVSTDLGAKVETVRGYIRSIDLLYGVLPWFALACFLWAFALSWQRRQTGLVIVVSIIIVMLIEIIALKWIRQTVLNNVRSDEAVGYIFDELTAWLRSMIGVVIATSAVFYALLMTGGPYHWARVVRSYIHIDQLKDSKAAKWWRDARRWVGQNERYLWTGVVVFVLGIVTLLAEPTTSVLISAVLIILSGFALLRILATGPRTVRKKM